MAINIFRRLTSSAIIPRIRRIQRVEKCSNGFIRVSKPLNREILVHGWKSVTGNSIDFVLAKENDFNIVAQFWGEEFSRNNNLCRHLGMMYDDFEALASIMVEKVLKQGFVVMAFSGDKLIATMLALSYDESQFGDIFCEEPLGNPFPVFRIKANYAKDISSMPYNPKLNSCVAMMHDLEVQTGQYLSSSTKKLGCLEGIVVHSSMQREGIGGMAISLADKLLVTKHNVDEIICVAVATYSTRICRKLGYETLFKFHFKNYKSNGRPVFYSLHDGSKYVDMIHRTVRH